MDRLLCDFDIASLLRMSGSWVRKQRMLRRAGLPHVLAVDPIMIGTCPRYRLAEIEAWLTQQCAPQSAHDRPDEAVNNPSEPSQF
jgi:hypothetical protein